MGGVVTPILPGQRALFASIQASFLRPRWWIRAYLGTRGLAGDFYGNIYVHGDLTVEGSKAAVVPHPDGSRRQLYCLESPEMWFEDFGKADLVGGAADVVLNPDFAALVESEGYYVFLTEYGDSEGQQPGPSELQRTGASQRYQRHAVQVPSGRQEKGSSARASRKAGRASAGPGSPVAGIAQAKAER